MSSAVYLRQSRSYSAATQALSRTGTRQPATSASGPLPVTDAIIVPADRTAILSDASATSGLPALPRQSDVATSGSGASPRFTPKPILTRPVDPSVTFEEQSIPPYFISPEEEVVHRFYRQFPAEAGDVGDRAGHADCGQRCQIK